MNAVVRYDKYFLRSGRIFLWGDITESRARYVVQSMRYLADHKAENILLYIHSGGGETDSEAAIIDEMLGLQSVGINIYTIVQGKAFSAAADILALGSPGCRHATRHSSIMLHPLSYALDHDYAKQNKKVGEFMDTQNEIVNRLVAKACGKKSTLAYKKFVDDIQPGLWMTAAQAVKYGVVDAIWEHKSEEGLLGGNEEDSE